MDIWLSPSHDHMVYGCPFVHSEVFVRINGALYFALLEMTRHHILASETCFARSWETPWDYVLCLLSKGHTTPWGGGCKVYFYPSPYFGQELYQKTLLWGIYNCLSGMPLFFFLGTKFMYYWMILKKNVFSQTLLKYFKNPLHKFLNLRKKN